MFSERFTFMPHKEETYSSEYEMIPLLLLSENNPLIIIIFQLKIHFVLLKIQLKLFQVYEVLRFLALSKFYRTFQHFIRRNSCFLDKKQVLENGISEFHLMEKLSKSRDLLHKHHLLVLDIFEI